MSKITEINKKAVKTLKRLYDRKDIRYCELGDRICNEHCTRTYMLSFAHRHKRLWYKTYGLEKLSDFNQTILCCISCHNILETDKYLTENTFNLLRGKELLY